MRFTFIFFFFFNDTATTEIYTLSLHDALPIYLARKLSLRRKRSSPNVFEMAATETITSIILMVSVRSEERFSRNAETDLVCRLLLEKKKKNGETIPHIHTRSDGIMNVSTMYYR